MAEAEAKDKMNQEFSFQWGRGGCRWKNTLGMEWESTPGNFAGGESVETRGVRTWKHS